MQAIPGIHADSWTLHTRTRAAYQAISNCFQLARHTRGNGMGCRTVHAAGRGKWTDWTAIRRHILAPRVTEAWHHCRRHFSFRFQRKSPHPRWPLWW